MVVGMPRRWRRNAVALGQATANGESAIALGTDTSATANKSYCNGGNARCKCCK